MRGKTAKNFVINRFGRQYIGMYKVSVRSNISKPDLNRKFLAVGITVAFMKHRMTSFEQVSLAEFSDE